MTLRNLLIFAIMASSTFFFCSYKAGAAGGGGYDCTGAETGLGNVNGCSAGNCHGNTATTGITVALAMDSAGVPVTKYRAGVTYNLTLTGTNTTANSLPKFGFQISAILGSTTQTTPTNAGTFQQSGLPAGVQYTAANATYYVTNVVEHSHAITATSGGGATGSTYVESFSWTAPAHGTGTISFWCALNAVDGNGDAGSSDKWNTMHLAFDEDTSTAVQVSGVADLKGNMSLNVYPNPTTDFVQLEMNNAINGTYNLMITDLSGREISNSMIVVTGNSSKTTLNTSGWAAGFYFARLSKDGVEKVMRIPKR